MQDLNQPKEVTMTTATKATKSKAAKPAAKKTSKAAKALKTIEKDAASVGRHAKRETALAYREAGKTFKEIAELCGYANPGAAHNGVKRAKEAAEAK
jgi:hypothetical protein